MTGDEFKVAVAAANGRQQRLVSIERIGVREFRDHINPHSATSRRRVIHSVADGCGIDPGELAWLDERIILEADRADEEVDRLLGEGSDEDRRSTADLLVELALANYLIGRTHADEAFAVKRDGPNVALMFRGSRDALRSSMSRAFRQVHDRTPNGSALADALTTLQGDAYEVDPEEVHLRLAEHENAIVLDLGDSSGRAVRVEPEGWCVLDRSPILFRRTAATGCLPVPERGGNLSELRQLMNVSSETWPLVVGWTIAALIPNMPHPILLLGGQQGTGKTSAARQLGGLIDPSPAQLRSQPRDPETWAISASASWLVSIDNISTISEWWSDALCKAVTGDGWLRRKLYSDGDLAVLSFRRVLTSIDPGALRGDLGDRILLVDLDPINETHRRPEREIEREYEAARPRIFGALLDLLAKVLSVLPDVRLDRHPRMADFARLLAAMDQVLADAGDRRALDIYLGQGEQLAQTVIESDQVGVAIQSLLEEIDTWEGTTRELLTQITPEKPPKDWPRTAQALGGQIRRLTPALKQAGITVIHPKRSARRRVLTLIRQPAQNDVTNVTLVTPAENDLVSWDGSVTTGDKHADLNRFLVTAGNAENAVENGLNDNDDECDNQIQSPSDWSGV